MAQGNKNPKTDHLKDHQFSTTGKYKHLSSTPVSIKLPSDLDDFVRKLDNRNQWLIDAVAEKVAKQIDNDSIP